MNIHDKLAFLRDRGGMSQADLASQLHISRQAVSRWENGTCKPPLDTMVTLSNIYGVSLDWLCDDSQSELPHPKLETSSTEVEAKSKAFQDNIKYGA